MKREVRTNAAVRSLHWDGDDLVDRVDGDRRWTPDGVEHEPVLRYPYAFDRAVFSPSGRYSVIYTERGTKGLLLDGRRIVRELDRSYYHAEDFDYPVALGVLADGREVLVHCPEDYEVLEIEDVATGERLTMGKRAPRDIFHSRLAVSPDGRRLLSAGWLWSPLGIVEVYDLEQALREPASLDRDGQLSWRDWLNAEVDAVCWLDADRLVVATGEEEIDEDEPGLLGPKKLGVWSVSAQTWLYRHRAEYAMGTLLGNGERVIVLCEHPRLLDVTTGELVAEWPEVRISPRVGSYGVTHVATPVAALHPNGTCLAVAHEDGIAVIELP